TARLRVVPQETILATTGSSKYASTPATANGTRMGWRKPITVEKIQIKPTATAPMATTDRVVNAAQIDFFCHGVGYSGGFIRAYLQEGVGRVQERSVYGGSESGGTAS